jgi:flagellar assembly factor FliW
MTSTAEQVAEVARPATAGGVVRVRSTRFGAFEVSQDQVLRFPQGMIGLPEARRYVIVDHRPGSPFKWMLALDDPELGFAIANPYELVPGYRPPLELAARLLEADPEDLAIFVVVTIPSDPAQMTVNLMAPVAVHLRTRIARQIVLEDPHAPPAYRLLPPATAARR